MIKLKHIINSTVTSELDLAAGDFIIGRDHGCSLQLDDGVVSGEHARITLVPNEFLPDTFEVTIRDLGSTNGTHVNGVSVKEQRLENGDLIRIGSYEYKVFDEHSNVGTQTEYLPE